MLSWVISPVFSLIIAFVMFKIIVKIILVKKDSFVRALKLSPRIYRAGSVYIVLSFLFKTPLGKKLAIESWAALLAAFIFAVLMGYAGMVFLRRFYQQRMTAASRRGFPQNTNRHILLRGGGPGRK